VEQTAKQQAVEQIKQATNVLITVSTNPSVDQLAASIGLTLMLNKLGKHATAVVSGRIPPAINFLDPTKNISGTVDGLRDFIISLDKEKADKLRYKVEDNVVKIFITPYNGEISEKDLQFSQGDFNVEVVLALGVTKKDDLDNAIKAHGRILHDATVITVNAGSQNSDLGSIDWQDAAASSLCEMMVSVSESFGGGLLDGQTSTAFLTGIDAATERFSNGKTTPKVMTMAAQLMAAGANQQQIASSLQPKGQNGGGAKSISQQPPASPSGGNGSTPIPMEPEPIPEPQPAAQVPPTPPPLPPQPETPPVPTQDVFPQPNWTPPPAAPAAKKNVIHKNKAARNKARYAKMAKEAGGEVAKSKSAKASKKPAAKKS
jgi:hypothetical protein